MRVQGKFEGYPTQRLMVKQWKRTGREEEDSSDIKGEVPNPLTRQDGHELNGASWAGRTGPGCSWLCLKLLPFVPRCY